MEDLIRRQDALKAINEVDCYGDGIGFEVLSHAHRDVALLPSVEAIPINWILDYKDKYTVITSEECDPVKAEVIADMLAEWAERNEQ